MSTADKVRNELLEEFRASTRDRLEKISLGWMGLEKNPEDATGAQNLLRQLHSLKGESKMMVREFWESISMPWRLRQLRL